MEDKTYTVILEEDENGECILPLPDDLFDGENPWIIGDTISFEMIENTESVLIKNITWQSRQDSLGDLGD